MAASPYVGMQRDLPYFVVSSTGVTHTSTIEVLALVWADCFDDPGAEIRASPPLSWDERRLLGALVFELMAARGW